MRDRTGSGQYLRHINGPPEVDCRGGKKEEGGEETEQAEAAGEVAGVHILPFTHNSDRLFGDRGPLKESYAAAEDADEDSEAILFGHIVSHIAAPGIRISVPGSRLLG